MEIQVSEETLEQLLCNDRHWFSPCILCIELYVVLMRSKKLV